MESAGARKDGRSGSRPCGSFLLQVRREGHGEGRRCTVLAVLAAAALPWLEHLAKNDESLSLLVFGDWGRKGECNQSKSLSR
jgi:hypothetical protein